MRYRRASSEEDRMKRWGLRAAIVLGLPLLCPLAGWPENTAVEVPPTVTVAVLAALTGDAASMGSDCRRGVELGREVFAPGDRIGAHRLVFLFGDHRGEGRSAVTEFQRVVASGGAQVVLTHHSQPTMQINPLSAAARIPVLGVVSQNAFVAENEYAFRFWPTAEDEAAALSRAMSSSGVKQLALISLEDEYTLSLRERLLEKLEAEGVAVAGDERVLRSDVDLQPVLWRLLRGHPDGLLVNIAVGQIVPFVRKLRESGYHGRVFGNLWFMMQEIQKMYGAPFLDGVVFARLDTGLPEFRRQMGRLGASGDATPVLYACFTEFAALAQALTVLPAGGDSEAIAKALRDLHTVGLPDGPVPMEHREVRFPLTLKVIRGGVVQDLAGN